MPLLKSLLAVVASVGGGCAVGIPVFNSFIGGGQSDSAKSIKKCESNGQDGGEQVDFSGEKKLHICGIIDPSQSSHEASSITEEQKYSDLFKATWDNREGDWNYVKLNEVSDESEEFWSSGCEYEPHKGGALSDKNITTDGKYYLGICKKGENNSKTWVEVDGKYRDKLAIKLCQGNCGSDQQGSGEHSQMKNLKQPTSNNGYTVTFKKQKVIQPTVR